MSATTGITIACRLRPNGSMPPARGQPNRMLDGWMKSPGMPVTQKIKPILLEKRNRMRGVCMTCREMSARSSRTGTQEIITAAARLRIRQAPPQVNNVVSQAAGVADFADEAANANRTALSRPVQEDDAAGAGDSAEAAVSFP